jgi:hypothetical protein
VKARSLGVTLSVLTLTGLAFAEPRPALDDFYDRTRSRADGFEECLGYCDGQTVAAFLIGAQVADPTTDAVQRAIAYGGRLGADFGTFFGRYDVARVKLWADILRVSETDDTITDLAAQYSWFLATSEPGELGAHVSMDGLLAERTELEPSDFAEFQLVPYRAADVEVEVAPVADKVDKDAFLALPLGVSRRLRWRLDDDVTLERRNAVSAAFALRGFPKQLRHHYQLDVLRVKRTTWEVLGGEADAWTLSAGYQRLSPDVEWLQIWLLGGYTWNHGANDRKGVMFQLGAETKFRTDVGSVEIGPMFEEHFVLDQRTARFARVYDFRLYYRHSVKIVHFGASYQGVSLEDVATLHAVTPELGVNILGLDLTGRYRFSFVKDDRFDGASADRFDFAADWVF